MLLIHFDCVETNKDINKADYVKSICENLEQEGFVSSLIIYREPGMRVESSSIIETDEGQFVFRYLHKEIDSANQQVVYSDDFQLIFEFGTYSGILQMSVYIHSDSYKLSESRKYLEQLKLNIKNYVVRDWKTVEWLLDKDSECLSTAIYPQIFTTENLTRQLITEAMTKKYGSAWWDRFVPVDIRKKHKTRLRGYRSTISGFSNIDDSLLSIDVGDLIKIIKRKTIKWSPVSDSVVTAMLNESAEWNCNEVKRMALLKNLLMHPLQTLRFS